MLFYVCVCVECETYKDTRALAEAPRSRNDELSCASGRELSEGCGWRLTRQIKEIILSFFTHRHLSSGLTCGKSETSSVFIPVRGDGSSAVREKREPAAVLQNGIAET